MASRATTGFDRSGEQTVTESGIDLGNGDGTHDVTMDQLRHITGPEDVTASVIDQSGVVVHVTGVSGNVVTLTFYRDPSDGGVEEDLVAHADGNGICDIEVTAEGL